MDDMNVIVQSRGYLRSRVTKLWSKVSSTIDVMSETEKLQCLEKLNSLKSELSDMDKSLFPFYVKSGLSTDEMDKLMTEQESYEDKIMDSLGLLKSNNSVFPNVPNAPQNNLQIGRRLELPKVPLPSFSNLKSESYRKFIRSFEAIISKHSLTSHEKFIYLKDQLSKGPRTLIDSLDVGQQEYETAKDLLSKAFDNEITAKFDLIKTITDLKLSNGDDPYQFVGDMRTVISGAESANLGREDFLTYFIWQGLNEKFRNIMVSITNKSKPTLQEITDNIFEGINRYSRLTNFERDKSKNFNKNPKENTQNMAIGVKSKTYCGLCKFEGKKCDHDLRLCPIFSTPEQKVNKLKSMKACIKCSFLNHLTSECRFKFSSKCRFCDGQHMSFLCLKSGVTVKNKTTNNVTTLEVDTINSLSLIYKKSATDNISTKGIEIHFASDLKENILLETFTTGVAGEKSSKNIRIFKDSGSQRNFVTKDLAKSLGCKVTQPNVNLNINGFVAKKSLKSNIVNVQININDITHVIPAICVDKINTSFNVNEISEVIEKFTEKGYKLADNLLTPSSNHVGNIELVLGAESRHILPCQDKLFGPRTGPSVFIETPIGVILTGGLDKIKRNLSELPINYDENDTIVNSIISDQNYEFCTKK